MKKPVFVINTLILCFLPHSPSTATAAPRAALQEPLTTSASISGKQIPLSPQAKNFCDEKFVGVTLAFSPAEETTLNDLVSQIHQRFGVNFVMGPDIGKLPINIRAGAMPWNLLLRSQLLVSGVVATCVSPGVVLLVKGAPPSPPQSRDVTKASFIKLKYLRPTTGGNVDVAGQRSARAGDSGYLGGCGESFRNENAPPSACGRFEKLLFQLHKILKLDLLTGSADGDKDDLDRDDSDKNAPADNGGNARYVSHIPGRGILVVRANGEETELINQIVAFADRPPFQVVIKGLVYTANETRLRDIGLQTIITETGGRTIGSILGIPVGTGGTLFDFSTIVGSFEFFVQANALERNGVISVKSRPFATVLDGEVVDLAVGRQVPVILQSINAIGGQPGSLEILQAGNLLSVTPHVIDDENGNPTGVNLELQLESNEVDSTRVSEDKENVPIISARSIQTRMILNRDQTAILGGFTLDSDNRTVTKTPGLGDIPVIGELFKRRVRSTQLDRLYFALSVSVLPYSELPQPVKVPGATTDPPSLTPEMYKRATQAEPKQVTAPKPKKP